MCGSIARCGVRRHRAQAERGGTTARRRRPSVTSLQSSKGRPTEGNARPGVRRALVEVHAHPAASLRIAAWSAGLATRRMHSVLQLAGAAARLAPPRPSDRSHLTGRSCRHAVRASMVATALVSGRTGVRHSAKSLGRLVVGYYSMCANGFDTYIRALFDHPVTDPAWYWADDAHLPEVSPRMACSYIGALFRNSEATLSQYPDDRISQGLWFICSGATGLAPANCLCSSEVPAIERAEVVRASLSLFSTTMILRAPRNALLAELCHCWWDVLPLPWQLTDPDSRLVVDACFETMSQILELPDERCQRSSLWGLYIWSCGTPEPALAIAERFFATARAPSLVGWATRLGLLQRL